jgi:peptidyl-prolyl cis-trans isomerase C
MEKRSLFFLLSSAGVLMSSVACRKPPQDPPSNAATGDVVARIDGQPITSADFDRFVARTRPMRARDPHTPEGRRLLLSQLVQFEVMAKEAKDRGYDVDPETVYLNKQRMTTLLVQKEVTVSPSAVSEAQIDQYYASHTDDFQEPDDLRISEILVSDKSRADAVVAAAKALSPNDAAGFRVLVARYSEDPATKATGGDLGLLSHARRSLPTGVAEAATTLGTVGQVSLPVRTDHGYAILRLTERHKRDDGLSIEARNQIRTRLLGEARAKKMEEWTAAIKAKHNVEVLDKGPN